MKKITTMQDLADYINSIDDYNNSEVTKIIKENGWKDTQGDSYGICKSDTSAVVLDENTGDAKVVDI